jgi:hypothetical protein
MLSVSTTLAGDPGGRGSALYHHTAIRNSNTEERNEKGVSGRPPGKETTPTKNLKEEPTTIDHTKKVNVKTT